MQSKTTLIVSLLCASLVGCLDSEKQSSTSSSSSGSQANISQLSTVEMASVSNDRNCSNGKEGAVAYDSSQNAFFVCTKGQWSIVDLRGPKGEKGDTGATGSAGSVGATGANGSNGRDGIDGNGVRLSIKNGDQIIAVLVQYEIIEGQSAALLALPSGTYGYYTLDKGYPVGRAPQVYFTGANCTGEAYAGRSDSPGPHGLGRMYHVYSDFDEPNQYYEAIGIATGKETFQSYRQFDVGDYGERGKCINRSSTTPQMVKVIRSRPSVFIGSYVPLQFTF